MKIHPLFKWFSSKWSSAKHYPEPIFDTICEGFAGSAGYALNYCDRKVLLNEINPQLVALWSWLICNANEHLIREIPVNLKEGQDIRELGLSSGQALLVKHWQRTNNVGDCWTVSAWGNKPGQWTANTRARVAEEVSAVSHWEIHTRLKWWTLEEATLLLDPPYEHNYKFGCDILDYKRLARHATRASVANQVIACEAVCQKTGAVPEYLPFRHSHLQVTSRRKAENNVHSRELMFTRGPTRVWLLPAK